MVFELCVEQLDNNRNPLFRYPYFQKANKQAADVGNGVLVQQTMRDSYARQTGAVPNGGARVKFGQEATDEEFVEVTKCRP